MIPTALRIVALLQLLGGLSALGGMLVALPARSVSIDFGILGIPIYFGLMRRSELWRSWAVAFTWFGMLVSVAMFVVGLGAHVPAEMRFFGVRYGNVSAVWLSALAVPCFLVSLWQYRVLTRADVRAVCVQNSRQHAEPVRG